MATSKTRRNANRKMLRKARDLALVTGDVEANIDPADAFQYVLDRAFHMLQNASEGVSDLKADEIWRDTMVGRIPNEWIRLETDLRQEVFALSSKMISLGIDDRKARASEIMAAVLAPVLKGILDDLQLNKTQQAKAQEVIGRHLRVLEGGPSEELANEG